jgi:hypothetical protein
MTWINFDWFQWDAEQRGKGLDTTVKAIYDVAHQQFEKAHSDDLKGAESPDLDENDRGNYIDFLNEEFRGQRAALALMTLSLLTKSMVLHFKQITNGLNKQFPASGEVKGKSELERIVSEYQQRFGISLENLAHFATVREIVLARNSVFHGDGSPSKDYMEKTNARFLDEVGQINLTSELLNTSIAELKEFLLALSVALKDAYRAAKAAAQEKVPAG